MLELNDKNFASTLEVVSPMLVMFYADWAGPCNLVMPAYEEVHSRKGNQMDFMKFNLDGNPKTPHAYGVRSVPCFIMFVDGQPVNMIAGAVSADILIEACEEVLE